MIFGENIKVNYLMQDITQERYDSLIGILNSTPIMVKSERNSSELDISVTEATEYLKKPKKGSKDYRRIGVIRIIPKSTGVIYGGLENISKREYSLSFETKLNGETSSLVKLKNKKSGDSIVLWGDYNKKKTRARE